MKIVKIIRKRYIFSIFFIALLIFNSISVTTSVIKNNKNNIFKILEKPLSVDEWSDGEFKAFWGYDKNYSDGSISGELNHGKISTSGYLWGQWKNNKDASTGAIIGFFKDNLIIGTIHDENGEDSLLYIGEYSGNDTNFVAVIYQMRIGPIYIKGTYESSFLPPLTGPYGVGVRSLHFIDYSRLEDFTPAPDDFREMMIQLWYPIDKEIKEPRVNYMDVSSFTWLRKRSVVSELIVPFNAYEFVRPHGRDYAPIIDNEEKFPIIIFSPGYNGIYQIYTSFIEDLVSNGFVVASINHPYVSGITVFPDEREVYVSSDPVSDLHIRSVVEDAKFILDIIFNMNIHHPEFQGRFDTSKVGMYGHSFGGAATSICCYEDPRFDCGLTLDGVFYIDKIPNGVNKPMMLMLAEKKFNDDNVREMWEHLNNDGFKVEIYDSTHNSYTDVGILLTHLIPLVPPNILGFGSIHPKRHVNITKTFEQVFFEVYLKNRPVQDIINLANSYSDVLFEYK
jgi:hypothetical protein